MYGTRVRHDLATYSENVRTDDQHGVAEYDCGDDADDEEEPRVKYNGVEGEDYEVHDHNHTPHPQPTHHQMAPTLFHGKQYLYYSHNNNNNDVNDITSN